MMKAFAAPKSSTRSELEHRALLYQMGGYSYNGREILYSTAGRMHLEAVAERKARAARIEAVSQRQLERAAH